MTPHHSSSTRTVYRHGDRERGLQQLTLSSVPIELHECFRALASTAAAAKRLQQPIDDIIDVLTRVAEVKASRFSNIDLERLHPNIRDRVKPIRDRAHAKARPLDPGAAGPHDGSRARSSPDPEPVSESRDGAAVEARGSSGAEPKPTPLIEMTAEQMRELAPDDLVRLADAHQPRKPVPAGRETQPPSDGMLKRLASLTEAHALSLPDAAKATYRLVWNLNDCLDRQWTATASVPERLREGRPASGS